MIPEANAYIASQSAIDAAIAAESDTSNVPAKSPWVDALTNSGIFSQGGLISTMIGGMKGNQTAVLPVGPTQAEIDAKKMLIAVAIGGGLLLLIIVVGLVLLGRKKG